MKNIEIVISKQDDKFSDNELQIICRNINYEDMAPANVEKFRESYAMVGAYACHDNQRKLVGFSRLVERGQMSVSDKYIDVIEVGSVWVEPDSRGQGIGSELIKQCSILANDVKALPIAVCNDDSFPVFEEVGYIAVGKMQSVGGRLRVIEMYPSILASAGVSIDGLIEQLPDIERFESMNLLT